MSQQNPQYTEPRKHRLVRGVVVKNRRRVISAQEAPSEEIDPREPEREISTGQRLGRLAQIFGILLLLLPLAGGFLYLTRVRLQVLRAGIELARASRTQDELLQENRELRVEKASLRSPAKIAEEATTDLQMDVPDPSRMIVLDHKGEQIPELAPEAEAPESFGGHPVQ